MDVFGQIAYWIVVVAVLGASVLGLGMAIAGTAVGAAGALYRLVTGKDPRWFEKRR